MSEVPAGYEPIFRSSPFLDLVGPLYYRKAGQGFVMALRAEAKHCNLRETVHGGVLSTLADIALGYNTALTGPEPIPMVTASLSLDFAGSARLGDWIEVEAEVLKRGKSLAFANCYFFVGEERIARASGIFKIL